MYMLKGPNLSVHRLNEEFDSKGIYYLLNSITEKNPKPRNRYG